METVYVSGTVKAVTFKAILFEPDTLGMLPKWVAYGDAEECEIGEELEIEVPLWLAEQNGWDEE